MTAPAVVHQLAVVEPDMVSARCGQRTATRAGRLPADHTGWHSRVTCPACLTPPSWYTAGLPSKYPPR